jgi:hypothetical protein
VVNIILKERRILEELKKGFIIPIVIMVLAMSLGFAAPATACVLGTELTVDVTASGIAGEPVMLAITETNVGYDGATLENVYIEVSYDGNTDTYGWGDLAGGDNGNAVLNEGESWYWEIIYHPTSTTIYTITGHGSRGGVDVTAPLYPDEQKIVKVIIRNGVLLPTAVSIQMYASGDWPAMYDSFYYGERRGVINNVSPGVMFYYNTIEAPASGDIVVVQTNTANWMPFNVHKDQAYLYDTALNKVLVGTAQQAGDEYLITFNPSVLNPGETYYIGIKFSPGMEGQTIPFHGATQTEYFFSTKIGGVLQPGSYDSITLLPKP